MYYRETVKSNWIFSSLFIPPLLIQMDKCATTLGKCYRVDLYPENAPNLGLDRGYDGNYFITDAVPYRFVATVRGGLEELRSLF